MTFGSFFKKNIHLEGYYYILLLPMTVNRISFLDPLVKVSLRSLDLIPEIKSGKLWNFNYVDLLWFNDWFNDLHMISMPITRSMVSIVLLSCH